MSHYAVPPLLMQPNIFAILHDLVVLERRRRNLVNIYWPGCLRDPGLREASLRKLLEHMRKDHERAPGVIAEAETEVEAMRQAGDTEGSQIWSRVARQMREEWDRMEPLMAALP